MDTSSPQANEKYVRYISPRIVRTGNWFKTWSNQAYRDARVLLVLPYGQSLAEYYMPNGTSSLRLYETCDIALTLNVDDEYYHGKLAYSKRNSPYDVDFNGNSIIHAKIPQYMIKQMYEAGTVWDGNAQRGRIKSIAERYEEIVDISTLT